MEQQVIITIKAKVGNVDNQYSAKAIAYQSAKSIEGVTVESVTVGIPKGPRK